MASRVEVAPPNSVPVNCPRCGTRLPCIFAFAGNHVYHCLRDGLIVLTPDGMVRAETPDVLATRLGLARGPASTALAKQVPGHLD